MSFGILESYPKTLLAIVTSIALELVLGRIFFHKWVHPASAYISGISVGILVRSPAFWPYALCAAISITSKYVLRVKGRHIWNPSNFGISVMLFLAAETVATLSIQWGNYLLPMLVIWVLGSVIIWRLHRFHITGIYVASFIAFAFLRSWMTGQSVAVGDRAHHRADVSALHLLHDHRSENHGADQARTMPRRVPGGAGGNGAAAGADCLRAFLCALHRGPDRDAGRDLARFAPRERRETDGGAVIVGQRDMVFRLRRWVACVRAVFARRIVGVQERTARRAKGCFVRTCIGSCAINASSRRAAIRSSAQPSRPSGPIVFTDVTAQAGIHFKHNSGAFGKKYLPETMGSGACFLDYDNDGWQDIFLVNSMDWPEHKTGKSFPALYHNNHDGTFTDVTQQGRPRR